MTRALPAGTCAYKWLLGRSALPPTAAAPCRKFRRDKSLTPALAISCDFFPMTPSCIVGGDQHLLCATAAPSHPGTERGTSRSLPCPLFNASTPQSSGVAADSVFFNATPLLHIHINLVRSRVRIAIRHQIGR